MLLAAPLGFEPRLTPAEGNGFRDRCANHYTTGQYQQDTKECVF